MLTFADEATTEKPAADLCRTQYSENLHYSYLNGGQGACSEREGKGGGGGREDGGNGGGGGDRKCREGGGGLTPV